MPYERKFMLLGTVFLVVIGVSIYLGLGVNKSAKPQNADLIETSGVRGPWVE